MHKCCGIQWSWCLSVWWVWVFSKPRYWSSFLFLRTVDLKYHYFAHNGGWNACRVGSSVQRPAGTRRGALAAFSHFLFSKGSPGQLRKSSLVAARSLFCFMSILWTLALAQRLAALLINSLFIHLSYVFLYGTSNMSDLLQTFNHPLAFQSRTRTKSGEQSLVSWTWSEHPSLVPERSHGRDWDLWCEKRPPIFITPTHSEYRTAEYAHHLNHNCIPTVRFPLELRERRGRGPFACGRGCSSEFLKANFFSFIFSHLFNSMVWKKMWTLLTNFVTWTISIFVEEKREIRKGFTRYITKFNIWRRIPPKGRK